MGDKVAQFRPDNGQNLENIPHMLRYWADEIERGSVQAPETVVMALIYHHDVPADMCIFGKEMSCFALAGALMALSHLPVQYVTQEG